ncbi:cryptochrome/photolyase family protein [Ponticoccus sp. (in: a-proteobacteria)]|uniref:cryptochrome/photolyase family protein n=1 Tax=Ponticoccus sp. (in: a-proteobacteria) TaxID=1925025 RepID=UPI003AB8EFB2
MSKPAPALYWVRRDLRLSDNAALRAAAEGGRPVIPVFIRDSLAEGLGTAPQWRLGLGLGHFAEALDGKGLRLVLRSGDPVDCLVALVRETGAEAVHWTRAYDPDSVARDKAVKAALEAQGITAQSHTGHLMFQPWTVETRTGGYYKVYTPFWKAVRGLAVNDPLPVPATLKAPASWPDSEKLDDWRLGAGMRRGAGVVRPYVRLGECAAQSRLGAFMASKVADYGRARDAVAEDGTSCLSENLSLGEITPAQCWHAGRRAMEEGKAGAETFLKELVWREFAYHLMWHSPRLLTGNWREDWDAFPWNEDARLREVRAWKQGRTGVPFVDAAMREMYVTGRMHNRARMIVASYLTKHLMCHWKIGLEWFEDCLIDWDPASNALGWQWSAGSGPDATPYFRVFNPETQAEKFDFEGRYRDRWIAEGRRTATETALSYFDAIPESWPISARDDYPEPIVGVKEGREKALAAYQGRDF